MTAEEKELIEEKFKRVYSEMSANADTTHLKLDRILDQVIKTNGRVTILETKESNHVVNCPQAPKVKVIEDNLLEYKMFLKYPKLIGIGLIAMALMIFFEFARALKLF